MALLDRYGIDTLWLWQPCQHRHNYCSNSPAHWAVYEPMHNKKESSQLVQTIHVDNLRTKHLPYYGLAFAWLCLYLYKANLALYKYRRNHLANPCKEGVHR